jgi:hypothetical protein
MFSKWSVEKCSLETQTPEHFSFNAGMLTYDADGTDEYVSLHEDSIWIPLQDIFQAPYADNFPNLKHLGLANIFTPEDNLYLQLSSLPAIQTIELDTLMTESEEIMWPNRHNLLQNLKQNLIDPPDGAWRTLRPRLTIRQLKEGFKRVMVVDEVNKFLYEGGKSPYQPPGFHEISQGVGWILNDFFQNTGFFIRTLLSLENGNALLGSRLFRDHIQDLDQQMAFDRVSWKS